MPTVLKIVLACLICIGLVAACDTCGQKDHRKYTEDHGSRSRQLTC
jgi:hypothetical protein